MSEQAGAKGCRCQIVGWRRDPYEQHISAQPEWEQADDCPVHPLTVIARAVIPPNSLKAGDVVNWKQIRDYWTTGPGSRRPNIWPRSESELREENYREWCYIHGLDPESVGSAISYEYDFDPLGRQEDD